MSVLDLTAEQQEVGQSYQELYEAVHDLKRRHNLHVHAVRPRDGLSLRRDAEKEHVLDVVKRFRTLPLEQQRRLPALLNSLAQLEVVVGDLDTGQQDYQEVARLVDRHDVAEELQRLRSHVALARDVLRSGGPCGKRLDFLAQELMREANTIGSKSSSAVLVQELVGLKSEIERLREQVQNVE